MMTLWRGVSPADTLAEKYSGTDGKTAADIPRSFDASSLCSTCHQNVFRQFTESMHAKSFTNPLFKKMFFRKLLKRSVEDEALAQETKDCIACHSPLTYFRTDGNSFGEQDLDPDSSGVECDFCHRITGYRGPVPQNGNYIAEPGRQKFGPIPQQSNWHHTYAELQTKSEFCAICHNRVNRFGLEIISTYSEWKESRYARSGIDCQDCHMNINGFLTGGEPVFESGYAAQNSLARSPQRSRLYTHRFPGAHSESQVNGAINLDIQVDGSTLVPGQVATIHVRVDNSKSGHKLPTGTAELRLLYLDIYARAGDRIIPLPAQSLHRDKFDVSGESRFDAEILGEDFPPGRRLYRAICIDSAGMQTHYAYDAEKIIFDNRLDADEIRKEFFLFPVPEDAGSEWSIIAKLYYLRYPDPFAERLDVARAKRIDLATVRKNIMLGGQPDQHTDYRDDPQKSEEPQPHKN